MKSVHDQRYIEIISLIRKARERSGHTQEDVAQMLGLPQSYVSKVETCERRIDVIEVLQLCRVIGVTLSEVIPAEFLDLLGESAHD